MKELLYDIQKIVLTYLDITQPHLYEKLIIKRQLNANVSKYWIKHSHISDDKYNSGMRFIIGKKYRWHLYKGQTFVKKLFVRPVDVSNELWFKNLKPREEWKSNLL